jgi:hypothetical protein
VAEAEGKVLVREGERVAGARQRAEHGDEEHGHSSERECEPMGNRVGQVARLSYKGFDSVDLMFALVHGGRREVGASLAQIHRLQVQTRQ